MKILDYKFKCGCDDFIFLPRKEKPELVGVYCFSCGQCLKWANKNEKHLMEYLNRRKNEHE